MIESVAVELQNQSGPDVIIVDDLEVNQVILIQMIESMGYQAAGVGSGEEALALVKEHLPKLFLLDITMPGMSGFELCEILKNEVLTRDIPVIFISATSNLDDKVMGFTLGGADFISKPFALAEVTARVSTHLRSYEMKKENEFYNKKLRLVLNEQMKKLEDEKKNVLYAIAKITEKSANFAESRLSHIKVNARLLAQSLQFSPKFEDQVSNDFIEAIELAAPLHDVGKVMVPHKILTKEGKLEKTEEELLKMHTKVGAEILEEIYEQSGNEFITMAIKIARYHHERWDGNGYPEGLKAEEIPLEARIVNILSSYDTLTGERSYKKAYSPEESIEIMEKDAGTKYDPDIFGIFKRIRKQLVTGA